MISGNPVSVNLTTLLLGRLRPTKQLTSTKCTYFCQSLTAALLDSVAGEMKVSGQTGYGTSGCLVKWTIDCTMQSSFSDSVRIFDRLRKFLFNPHKKLVTTLH